MGELASEVVRVKPSTKQKLDALGNKNDTYDDIITRLLKKVGS